MKNKDIVDKTELEKPSFIDPTPTENFFDFQRLPNEILLSILLYLNLTDIGNIAQIGKRFENITKDNQLWHYLLIKDFNKNQNGKWNQVIYQRKHNFFKLDYPKKWMILRKIRHDDCNAIQELVKKYQNTWGFFCEEYNVSKKKTYLQYAIKHNSLRILRFFLESVKQITSKNSEYFNTHKMIHNGFYEAIKYSSLDVIKLFLEYAKDFDIDLNKSYPVPHSTSKQTPLIYAIYTYSVDNSLNQKILITYLIDKGANINLSSEEITPLDCAILNLNQEIIGLLIKNNALLEPYSITLALNKIDKLTRKNVSVVDDIILKLLIGGIKSNYDKDVHSFLEQGLIRSVTYIINKKLADINIINEKNGFSLLHQAICAEPLFPRPAYKELIECLLIHHINVNIKDKNGENALFYAAKHNQFEYILLLLVYNTDFKIANKKGFTIFQTAMNLTFWQLPMIKKRWGASYYLTGKDDQRSQEERLLNGIKAIFYGDKKKHNPSQKPTLKSIMFKSRHAQLYAYIQEKVNVWEEKRHLFNYEALLQIIQKDLKVLNEKFLHNKENIPPTLYTQIRFLETLITKMDRDSQNLINNDNAGENFRQISSSH